MKRLIGILTIAVMGITTGLNADPSNNNSKNEAGINIHSEIVSNELIIEVDEQLAETVVTVSVFNKIGEIVLQEKLGLGLNKVDVTSLVEGEYVAVVRENDVYKSKSNFKVI